jgi:very-short-patch-repair endonuclease
MDFLVLLPNRARAVLEVDGMHHYASDHRADPARYGAMVAEDRRLRLAGYEVFRFGGHELQPQRGAAELVEEFVGRLLSRHGVQERLSREAQPPHP